MKKQNQDDTGNRKYKDIQDEIRQSSRHYDIDRRKETLNIIQKTDT